MPGKKAAAKKEEKNVSYIYIKVDLKYMIDKDGRGG